MTRNSWFGDISDWFLNSWTNFNCGGYEESLSNCQHQQNGNCDKNTGIGIVCSNNLNGKNFLSPFVNSSTLGNITLVGGPTTLQGNVFVNGMPVCDDGWDMKDAWVVCKQLGFPSVVSATANSKFGSVPSTFRMDDVGCTGEETSLLECEHNRIDNCGSSEGAGVICSHNLTGRYF